MGLDAHPQREIKLRNKKAYEVKHCQIHVESMLASVAGCLPHTNRRADSVTQELNDRQRRDLSICQNPHCLHNRVNVVLIPGMTSIAIK